MEPPICAIGPSRPTDAPAPSEMAAPAALRKIHRRLMRAPPRCIIARNLGKPYPSASPGKKYSRMKRRVPPLHRTTGISKRNACPSGMRSSRHSNPRNTVLVRLISRRKPRLPSALRSPVVVASKISHAYSNCSPRNVCFKRESRRTR